MDILRQRTAALQALTKSAAQEDKARIAQQLQLLRQLMCKIDITAAAQCL
jgi:hypothetical protein